MCVHKEQGCPALTLLSRRLPAYAYKLSIVEAGVVGVHNVGVPSDDLLARFIGLTELQGGTPS